MTEYVHRHWNSTGCLGSATESIYLLDQERSCAQMSFQCGEGKRGLQLEALISCGTLLINREKCCVCRENSIGGKRIDVFSVRKKHHQLIVTYCAQKVVLFPSRLSSLRENLCWKETLQMETLSRCHHLIPHERTHTGETSCDGFTCGTFPLNETWSCLYGGSLLSAQKGRLGLLAGRYWGSIFCCEEKFLCGWFAYHNFVRT